MFQVLPQITTGTVDGLTHSDHVALFIVSFTISRRGTSGEAKAGHRETASARFDPGSPVQAIGPSFELPTGRPVPVVEFTRSSRTDGGEVWAREARKIMNGAEARRSIGAMVGRVNAGIDCNKAVLA